MVRFFLVASLGFALPALAEPAAPLQDWYAFFDALEPWQGGVAVRCTIDDPRLLQAGHQPASTAWSKAEGDEWVALVREAEGVSLLVSPDGRVSGELVWSASEAGCAVSVRKLSRAELRATEAPKLAARPAGSRWELQLDAVRNNRSNPAPARQLAELMLHEAKAARALEMSETLANAQR